MSLTSVHDDRNSRARAFLENHFPNTRKVTGETNSLLRKLETIRPNENVPWTTSGTAFDYRMRYFFAVTPSEELVAWKGARQLSDEDIRVPAGEDVWYAAKASEGSPYLSKGTIESFFRDLDETVSRIQPVGRELNQEEEELLLRYCVVLALFEDCARAVPPQGSPLFSVGANPTTAELLKLAQRHWIDDLGALTREMVKEFGSVAYSRIVLNPTFSGTPDVGGADADLILDDCLLEIKSTVKASIAKLHLYQLLGYMLVDYDNWYELERAGFYMARQRQLFIWPISDLIARLMTKAPPKLMDLRQEFRETLASERLPLTVRKTSLILSKR